MSTTSVIKRNTIQIMSDGFTPEQLPELINSLERNGHRCSVFDGVRRINGALRDPCTKLLLVATTEKDVQRLRDAIRASAEDRTTNIPIMAYLKQSSGSAAEVLMPEIDDFLFDPLSTDEVSLRVQHLLQRFTKWQDEVDHFKQDLAQYFGMQEFIGRSPAFLAVLEKIPYIAACDATVLLIGDTGTGKEMCARAIHYLSPRADKPFVPINCASIPENLFENEMFGHESGAYTDARQARRGLIAEAEHGTLFLDEVDSLPLTAQATLLRFLQDRDYKPLGSSHCKHADVRLLAASNQDLETKVREGSLRKDLYYRLKVISLYLPSLNERCEDVFLLASHFLESSTREYKRSAMRLSREAVKKLSLYKWPGNVRELENVIREAVVLAKGPVLRGADIRLPIDPEQNHNTAESFKTAKARIIESFEREYLSHVVAAAGGNISHAARSAKKDRRAFFALLKKHGLTSVSASQSPEMVRSL
jgi:two-component system response regulator GlrR